MANYSRDSFQATNNTLGELLGLVPGGAPGGRNYVSVRLQQAVPVVDADWNEEGDIRRREMELVLVRAIGNGVPAASDGFSITTAGAAVRANTEAGQWSRVPALDGVLLLKRDLLGKPLRAFSRIVPNCATIKRRLSTV